MSHHSTLVRVTIFHHSTVARMTWLEWHHVSSFYSGQPGGIFTYYKYLRGPAVQSAPTKAINMQKSKFRNTHKTGWAFLESPHFSELLPRRKKIQFGKMYHGQPRGKLLKSSVCDVEKKNIRCSSTKVISVFVDFFVFVCCFFSFYFFWAMKLWFVSLHIYFGEMFYAYNCNFVKFIPAAEISRDRQSCTSSNTVVIECCFSFDWVNCIYFEICALVHYIYSKNGHGIF